MILKSFRSKFRVLIGCLLFFMAGSWAFASDSNKTIITIGNADNTSYRKNKKDDTDEIVLNGNVTISVEKGETKLEIAADKVTYNRSTEMLFAEGGIKLVQTGSSAGEQTITASTLLVNTSTLEGIFDDGRAVQTQSDALNLPAGSTLIVASDIFGRDTSSTVAFKRAELTFCDEEDPHWKIRASRIWLLPGGEFAFLNAVVSVGHVPLLYLPVFYYPKDELIFNPTFGYKNRHGYYFQTTTYILGRKPLDDSSSDTSSSSSNADEVSAEDLTKGIFNFMKPSSLKEQRLEGLVLHNLEEDYKGDTSSYFKLIGDYYTNLGGVVGFDGIYQPNNKYVSSLGAGLQLGFTNTVFEKRGVYTPYSSAGEKMKDGATFLGREYPYRFGAKLNANVSQPFNLKLNMPIYSDPFFTEDFQSRSEYLDWISFFMGNNEQDNENNDESSDDNTSYQTSSFTWTADGSFNAPLPDVVKPYINKVAITSFNSAIIFNQATRSDDEFSQGPFDWQDNSPERLYFYPSQVTPIKITGEISGNIFEYPMTNKYYRKYPSVTFPQEIAKPEYLMTSKEKEKYEKDLRIAAAKKAAKEAGEEYVPEEEDKIDEEKKSKEKTDLVFTQVQPPVSAGDIIKFNGISYTLSYSVKPHYANQRTYNSDFFPGPKDFDWDMLYSSYYEYSSPTSLQSILTFRDSFISFDNSLTFDPYYQEHPNLDGYLTDSSKETVILSDYKAKKMNLNNANQVTVKPLVYNGVFNKSSLVWNSSLKIIDTEFIGDIENPEWSYLTGDLYSKDTVTEHKLTATLNATEDKFSQELSLSSNLPPQLEEYNETLTFGFPYFTITETTGIYECEEPEGVDGSTVIDGNTEEFKRFKWNPFKQSATLKLLDGDLNFTESYNYNIEEKYSDSMKLSASWKNLQLAYTMQYTTVYDFDESKGWVVKKDDDGEDIKEFVPYSVSLAYATKNKKYRYWKKRITWAPGLNTGLVYDCVRPTNSYFRFVPSVSFNVHEQFEITFSAESQNNVIFRYFQDYVGYKDAVSGEKNPIKDLYNSFVFWDDDNQTSRKSSGYKLKNLKVAISRHLHDWSMEGSLSFKPRSITDEEGKKAFDYHPYMTFAISWHPMPSMRSKLVDDYGEWKLNN